MSQESSANPSGTSTGQDAGKDAGAISRSIFKAYDIRGIVDKTLTEAAARSIGRVLGGRARKAGIDSIVVGRDGRLSGPRLAAALSAGIVESGVGNQFAGKIAHHASLNLNTNVVIA